MGTRPLSKIIVIVITLAALAAAWLAIEDARSGGEPAEVVEIE